LPGSVQEMLHADDSEAFLIADLLRTDRHRFAPWKPDGELMRGMKAELSLIDSSAKPSAGHSEWYSAFLSISTVKGGGGSGVFGPQATSKCQRKKYQRKHAKLEAKAFEITHLTCSFLREIDMQELRISACPEA
jgi:hypothetical protein